MSAQVALDGRLICTDLDEAQRVLAALPVHLNLTRAEPGCLFFDVVQSDDPLVFDVSERFVDQAAFEAHQSRAAASEWAAVTVGIARDYEITGSA